MDPYNNERNTRNDLNSRRNSAYRRGDTSAASGNNPTTDNPDGDAPDSGPPQTSDRQPQYSGGFTVVPPNESRRSKMRMMAQKEEEDLRRWKEANRATAVHLNPEKLGGNVTLAEARQKQFTDLRTSKLQKKLRKEELDKKRRQEEEEELERMKREKREMAERLEERRRLEEQRRREQLRQDHLRTTESFLQRFNTRAADPVASGSATHMSSGSEAVESKPKEDLKSVREVQLDHKRVNSAFLEKLERQGRGSTNPCFPSDDFEYPPSQSLKQQITHLNLDSGGGCSDRTEEADPEPDSDWALMKLINSFPDCSRSFLEDILDQCNGDYKEAYALLICTLN